MPFYQYYLIIFQIHNQIFFLLNRKYNPQLLFLNINYFLLILNYLLLINLHI